jgi:hypothetical protein
MMATSPPYTKHTRTEWPSFRRWRNSEHPPASRTPGCRVKPARNAVSLSFKLILNSCQKANNRKLLGPMKRAQGWELGQVNTLVHTWAGGGTRSGLEPGTGGFSTLKHYYTHRHALIANVPHTYVSSYRKSGQGQLPDNEQTTHKTLNTNSHKMPNSTRWRYLTCCGTFAMTRFPS